MSCVRGLVASLVLSVPLVLVANPPASADPGQRWGGLYIGAHVGGAWSDNDWSDVSLTGEPVSFSKSGVIGGVHAGVQHQFGNIVAGVEVTYSGLNLESDTRSVVNPSVVYTSGVRDLFTVSGRLGIDAGQWMPYVKAGYANGRIQSSGVNPLIPDSFSQSNREGGYVLGLGVDFKLSSNLLLGLEYDYVKLNGGGLSGTTAVGIPYTIDADDTRVQSIMARLTYKFNDDRRYPAPLK